MSTSDSYVISDMAASESHDEDLDSLPSISSDLLSSEASESPSDAQKEWEESLEQIQLLLTMVVVPFAGKYLGRKFAYWSAFPIRPSCLPRRPGQMRGEKQTIYALLADTGGTGQAGRGTWSGHITSRCGGRTRRPGKPRVLPRRLLRYDAPRDYLWAMLPELETVTDDLGPVAAEGGVKNEQRLRMAWCDVTQTRLLDGGQTSGEHSIIPILDHVVGLWLTPDLVDRMDGYI